MGERLPPCTLTTADKVRIVRLYSINGEFARATRRVVYQAGVGAGKWKKVGLERAPVTTHQTMIYINKMFEETGCVEERILKTFQSKRTITTAENLQHVYNEVLKSPDVSKSHRRLSATLRISNSSFSKN